MPTYEYACTQCGQRVEVVQSFSDAPLEKCDKCGGRLRRVFHPVGVLFKGSGFYSTDARASRGAGGSSNGDRERSKDSSSSSKSESGGSSNKEGESSASSNKKEGSTGSSNKEGDSNKKKSSSSSDS
jgi:putative FmdB family regulatory protein